MRVSELNLSANINKTMDLLNFKKLKNEEIKKQSEKRDFYASLWLGKVKELYEIYKYNLGFKRSENAPPRKYRPAIIVGKAKNKEYYRVIFLTTKKGARLIFNLQRCNYASCPEEFNWIEQVSKEKRVPRILIYYNQRHKPRKTFLISKEDLDSVMSFCGECDPEYIKEIELSLSMERK